MDKVKQTIKQKLNIFKLPTDRRETVERKIREEGKADFDFYALSIFAAIIITLGLIIDSGAVIIGGMLVAPMVWPALSLSLGIIKGSIRLLQRSFFDLIKVSLITFLIAYVIGLISPLTEFGTELLSRAQPTIYELLIALAAGFIGAFIVSYPGLMHAIAGVVVAAALVPPLGVMGLSLSVADMNNFGGSLLLFLSNLIAVTVAAAIYFIVANFKTLSYSVSEDRKKNNLAWSILFLIVICIPLVIVTNNTVRSYKQVQQVNKVIAINLPQSEIVETKLKQEDAVYFIQSTVRSHQNIRQYKMDSITNQLSSMLKEPVNLRILVIPIMEAGAVTEQLTQ